MKGYFITFEGPDGSGKTTQIGLLKDYLKEIGFEVVVTREPGGTSIGEAIREIILDSAYGEMTPVTEMLLYAAARAQHVDELIKPALESGKIVLCDRFVDSSLAYQGFGRGLGIELIERVNKVALNGINPDMTFFFDLDPKEGLKRGQARGEGADRLELESMDFHQRVYDGFNGLCLRYPDRFKRVDASMGIHDIHKETINRILQLLKDKK